MLEIHQEAGEEKVREAATSPQGQEAAPAVRARGYRKACPVATATCIPGQEIHLLSPEAHTAACCCHCLPRASQISRKGLLRGQPRRCVLERGEDRRNMESTSRTKSLMVKREGNQISISSLERRNSKVQGGNNIDWEGGQ